MSHPSPRSAALQILALAGMAGLAALVSNGLASPSRHLAWCGSAMARPALALQIERPLLPAPMPQPHPVEASRPPPADRPAQTVARPAGTPVQPKSQEAVVSSPIREITGPEAWKAFQSGMPFLDARRRAEFAEGHIVGAWCTPVWESDLDERLIAFKAARRPGPDDPIVIYCSGGDCQDSHLLAAKLLNEGYGHLLIYREGFPDWSVQNHPVEKGQP
jgi:rhodanese-related sulfurtransferase